MDVEITGPDWIEETITLRLSELNPHAVGALIETLRDTTGADDDRIRLLVRLL